MSRNGKIPALFLGAVLLWSAAAQGGMAPWETAVSHLALGLVLVVSVAAGPRPASGGRVDRAILIAIGCFVALASWSFLRAEDRYAAWVEWLRIFDAALLFGIAVVLLRGREMHRLVGGLLIAVAVGVSFLCWGLFAAAHGAVFPSAGARVSSPFVNGNHLGGLLAIVLPLAWCRTADFDWKRESPWAGAAAVAATAAIAATLLGTFSRGAILAAAFGICATAALVALRRLRIGSRRGRPAAGAIAVGLLLLIGLIFAEPLRDRFAPAQEGHEDSFALRTAVWRSSLEAAQSLPWDGFGLASFPSVYTQYRSPAVPYAVRYAHNEWLHFLIELGWLWIPCAALIGAATFLSIGLALRGRRGDVPGWVVRGTAAGLGAAAVHATVEFTLHIPAILFFVAILLAMTASFERRREGMRKPGKAPVFFRTAAYGSVLCILALTCIYAWRTAESDLALREGKRSLRSGDPFSAAERFRKAVMRMPQNAEAHHRLAMMLVANPFVATDVDGTGWEAEVHLDRAVALSPRKARYRRDLGWHRFVLQGEEEEGIEEMKRAASLDPRNPWIQIPLGDALAYVGRVVEAAAAYRAAVEASPRMLGMVLVRWEEHFGSDGPIRRALPDSLPILVASSGFYRDRGNLDEARRLLREASKLDPASAEPFLRLAEIERLANDSSARMRALKEVIARDPVHGRARVDLASFAVSEDRPADAEEHLRAALRLEPAYGEALRALSDLLGSDGRLREAEVLWQQAVERFPGRPDFRRALARFYLESDRWLDAVRVLREAAIVQPRHAAHRRMLADLYRAGGLIEQAESELARAEAAERSAAAAAAQEGM